MKPQGHLEKAKAFEDRSKRWESDKDAPSVIEDIFDAIVHYTAYGINIKYGKDIDSHSKQKKFLRTNNEIVVFHAYENIEFLRMKSVYGGGWNGERIREARIHLEAIKKWLETIGE
ncbi:MAG: hypothetical protein QGH39_03760 [Candidatus Thermoplasmatota archaeon]|jgi:hypothetical protein|nr:hypothetical protein [Candidatus Thermoplasmatota archaeon]MDP7264656.1 hypothetical protein [Candidatus Thermoplasmatota archaeon]